MSEKATQSVDDVIDEAAEAPPKQVRRLCNEIQLFDLCELEKCRFKDGRYCTDGDLLNRFEAIAEEELRPAVREGGGDDLDDGEVDEEEFDDVFDEDVFGDESYEEDE
jgi:hypothetical protein